MIGGFLVFGLGAVVAVILWPACWLFGELLGGPRQHIRPY